MRSICLFLFTGSGSCEGCGNNGHGINFGCGTSTGQIVDRRIQSQKNGTVGFKVTHALGNLVTDISCVDVRENECMHVLPPGR